MRYKWGPSLEELLMQLAFDCVQKKMIWWALRKKCDGERSIGYQKIVLEYRTTCEN